METNKSGPAFTGEALICEDNKMNLEVISEQFARLGIKTAAAENGEEGVAVFKERLLSGNLFDVVFMDIYMPVMDGIAAAAEIMKMETNVPIIGMTANLITEEKKNYYLANGMSACLGKPFTSRDLRQCLSKFMQQGSAASSSSRGGSKKEEARLKMITQFVNDNKTMHREIKKAIDGGYISQAHRLAHNLKCSAELLFKTKLQSAAQNVENLLNENEDRTTSSDLRILKRELKAVINELAPIAAEAEKKK